jgi:hypothetical protein
MKLWISKSNSVTWSVQSQHMIDAGGRANKNPTSLLFTALCCRRGRKHLQERLCRAAAMAVAVRQYVKLTFRQTKFNFLE